MKVTKTQSAENRQGIVDAAARLYREHGISGVGVADITRDAGLTHGGLYRHFESKDALVREACARAFEWTIPPLPEGAGLPPLQQRIHSYLSPQHRDAPGTGCPVAALAADVARGDAALSEVFAQGVERNIERFGRLLAHGTPAQGTADAPTRARSIHTLAAMVGTMVLARATAAARPELSEEVLATVRDWLCEAPDGVANTAGLGN
ncbi:MAG: TetR/AcrR family transcriptional regulator [Rhodoferax sp.]